MNKNIIAAALRADDNLASHVNIMCEIAGKFIKSGCPAGAAYTIYAGYDGFCTAPKEGYVLLRHVVPDDESLYESNFGAACRCNPDNINEVIDDLHELSGVWGNTRGALQHLAMLELFGAPEY